MKYTWGRIWYIISVVSKITRQKSTTVYNVTVKFYPWEECVIWGGEMAIAMEMCSRDVDWTRRQVMLSVGRWRGLIAIHWLGLEEWREYKMGNLRCKRMEVKMADNQLIGQRGCRHTKHRAMWVKGECWTEQGKSAGEGRTRVQRGTKVSESQTEMDSDLGSETTMKQPCQENADNIIKQGQSSLHEYAHIGNTHRCSLLC